MTGRARLRWLGATLALFAWAVAPRAARAEGPLLLGAQLALSDGARFPITGDEMNVALRRRGWQSTAAVAHEPDVRFGLTFHDVSLDLYFQGSREDLLGPAGADGRSDLHRGAIGIDLGYRLRIGRIFALTPFVGVSSLRTTMCFGGVPDGTSSPSLPPFEQILANPGLRTCLESLEIGLDVGLTLTANLRIRPSTSKYDALVTYVGLGPKLAFLAPLSRSRSWEKVSSDTAVELPAFEGPMGPVGGAYVGVVLEGRYGMEASH